MGDKIMENNNFLQVSDDPVKYMVFKKEFISYLADYHKMTYEYNDSIPLSSVFGNSVYQNGGLIIEGGRIRITFNEVVGEMRVFNDYNISLIALKMFLDRGFIEEREISPHGYFGTAANMVKLR